MRQPRQVGAGAAQTSHPRSVEEGHLNHGESPQTSAGFEMPVQTFVFNNLAKVWLESPQILISGGGIFLYDGF